MRAFAYETTEDSKIRVFAHGMKGIVSKVIDINPIDFCTGVKKIQDENAHIQDVFPNMSASDREFMISGTTDEEWDSIFPPNERT